MPASRRGFTLIELWASVAIIGLIASVTLPALFQAREAARRTHCQNHLRQMGIALHNFHDARGHFPPGWSSIQFGDDGSIVRPADLGCLWAWGAYLLPHLQQSPLHDQLDVAGFSDPPAPGGKLDLSLDVYLCPSDAGVRDSGWGLYSWDSNSESPLPQLVKGYAKSNYVAVTGNDDAPMLALQTSRGCSPRAGIFGNESATRLANILDGTSCTAAIGERDMVPRFKRAPRGAVWIRNVGELIAVNPASTMHGASPSLIAPPPVAGTGVLPFAAIHCDANSVAGVTSRHAPLNASEFGFSSQHPGGASFLFADGSVRFVSERIDAAAYEHLGAMADGEVLTEF